MTKMEIVRTISEEIGLTQSKTREVVQKTLDTILETLLQEGRVELRNFGVFEIRRRPARRGRNPSTGEIITLPDRWVVAFKPGKMMSDQVENYVSKEERGEPIDTVNMNPSPFSDQNPNQF